MLRAIIALVLLSVLSACDQAPHGNVSIVVTDGMGQPVEGAHVISGWTEGFGASEHGVRGASGLTDRQGKYTYRGRLWSTTLRVEKDGYYSSYLSALTPGDVDYLHRVYKDDSIPVTLRRKIKPVPMYAKEAGIYLPSSSGSFGYDLLIGDLVAPYGKGKITDMEIHVWPGKPPDTLDCEIIFPNSGDGIQTYFSHIRVFPQCELRMPQIAPQEGYKSTLSQANGNSEKEYKDRQDSNRVWMEEVNYFIRVRSRTPSGPIYGKIYGFFRPDIYGDDSPHLEFIYFLNPDGTRNVEFHPHHNLFTSDAIHESEHMRVNL